MERACPAAPEEEVRKLFCIEASPYWRTHHIPGAESDESPKRIGAFKANIIGINLVAVLQFAYGSYTANERLRDSALTLMGASPGRGQPLHARLAVGRNPPPQRLRIASPAATGRRVLRRKTVRGVPRRTADRAADG